MPASQFPRSVSVPIAGSMRRGTPSPFFCKCSFHVTSSCGLEYDKLREFHRKNIGALERRGGYPAEPGTICRRDFAPPRRVEICCHSIRNNGNWRFGGSRRANFLVRIGKPTLPPELNAHPAD